MPLDDLDDALELIGRERVEWMGMLGEFGGTGLRLGAQAGQLLAAVLLSVLL